MHHLRASQIFAIFSRASWILDPFRRLHKAQFMLVPRTTTAIESVVITFFLLVASACIPLILYISQQETQEHKERVEELAAAAAGRVAEAALRIRRQLEGRNDNDATRKRRRLSSRFQHERARQCIESDYFSPTPIFNDRQFERIFRLTKSIIEHLIQVCGNADPFFTDIQDVSGRYGIAPVAKVLMAVKLVAYGCSPSAFVDYFQMSHSTARQCLLKFCRIVSSDYDLQSVYARQMSRSDARRLSVLHKAVHGAAGMIGSLDCTHIGWKYCPEAWQGLNSGKSGKPTIVLEALVDHNLWFWHHSFGYPGSLNDINIWNRSCLLKPFLDGSFANDVDFEFRIGEDRVFHRLWVLVDGIYPELSRFVKTIQEPVGHKASRYARWQESARKDVERAFGVLQRKFHVLVRKIELWYVGDIANVVNSCICLHNMMVANRMAMGDEESEEFYAFPAMGSWSQQSDDDSNDLDGQEEPEQAYVNRRVAEMNLHANLYNTNHHDERISDRERQVLESLRFQYVQRRWECLYDANEHARLRDAIVNELMNMNDDATMQR